MNFVALYGSLRDDPDFKQTQSGISVCNMTVVTHKRIMKTKDGQPKDVYEYHKVVVWGKNAELCSRHLKAGSKVLVRGEIRTESYEKEGKKNFITKVQADEVHFSQEESKYRTKSEARRYDYEDVPL